MMKYVLFTGATGGLGRLCVKALSESGGWTVFATGNNEKVLKELCSWKHVSALKMNVADQENVASAYQQIQQKTKHLNAIVNFAGLTDFTSLIEGDSITAVERNLAVNLVGTARVNRVFFEMLHRGNGRIINCSSESGWMTPAPFAGPYVLSKHALEAYNDSLRRELLYLKIPVVKIQPGAYDTELTQQVGRYCDELIAGSRYYKKLLVKMKPMMMSELNKKNNPEKLVRTVIRAMEAKHPKVKYRAGTSWRLAFLELFSDRQVDAIYRMMYGK